MAPESRSLKKLALAGAIFAVPVVAIANAGTPLMWTGCCWLLLGNYAIGLLETWVASRASGLQLSARWIVIGNYVSALFGLLLVWICNENVDLTFAGFKALAAMWLIAFLGSIAVEAWFFGKAAKQLNESLKCWRASFIANIASYALLIPWTLIVGPTSFWRELIVVPARDLPSLGGRVYYLDDDLKSIRSIRLDGSDGRLEKHLTERAETVSVDPSKDGRKAELVLNDQKTLGTLGIANQAAILGVDSDGDADRFRPGWPMGGRPYRIEPKGTYVMDLFWPAFGLRYHVRGIKRTYALETPVAKASWHDYTLLPNGHVVAGINGWVVLLVPEKNRIAVLGRGLSPSVLLDPSVSPRRTQHRVLVADLIEGEVSKP